MQRSAVQSRAVPAVAIGDFDGNGTDDLLFHGSGGDVAVWYDGSPSTRPLAAEPRSGAMAGDGRGDLNGDGKDEILFWGADGTIAGLGGRSGRLRRRGDRLVNPSAYTFAGVGDYNGDGKDDLIFRNLESGDGSGELAAWIMDGYTPIGQGNVDVSTHAEWLFA